MYNTVIDSVFDKEEFMRPVLDWFSESHKMKFAEDRTSSGRVLNNVPEAIGYKEALRRVKILKDRLNEYRVQLDKGRRSDGSYLWLYLYTLALCAQEVMINSMNDELVASDVPWDQATGIPCISATIGDATSYAERLPDPQDHFLKALLLSFSGWTLLSTEKKECACSKGKLEEKSVDVLVNTNLEIVGSESLRGLKINFLVGVQSDDPDHLEKHYSFKEKSSRAGDLIIIHNSTGWMYPSPIMVDQVGQAEQFRASRMIEMIEGLISSFDCSTVGCA